MIVLNFSSSPAVVLRHFNEWLFFAIVKSPISAKLIRQSIMFTLKFFRQNGNQETVVTAAWYEVFGSKNRFTIVIHQEMPCANGVGFEISNNTDFGAANHFQECFIENQKGKTIAAYRSKLDHEIIDEITDEASGD